MADGTQWHVSRIINLRWISRQPKFVVIEITTVEVASETKCHAKLARGEINTWRVSDSVFVWKYYLEEGERGKKKLFRVD